jgi:uncharacterized membrane protein (DUF2068 family)
MSPSRPELVLRLIILEKLVKGCLWLSAALVLGIMLITGSSVHLHTVVSHVREHLTSALAIDVADALVSVTERRHLAVATAAIFLDGVAVMVEWYALRRGHAWGEWLVVGATSVFLPFEVVALVRRVHAGRVALFVLNLAIVLYLARHVMKRSAARRAAAP